jgi:hypothetical protein
MANSSMVVRFMLSPPKVELILVDRKTVGLLWIVSLAVTADRLLLPPG